MKILTDANKSYPLNQIPDAAADIRYCVLDYSDPLQADFFFLPLLYLESFPMACADMRVGSYSIQMPLDWHVVVGDIHSGALETISIIDLNDKDFDVFAFNPIKGYMPQFLKFELVNVYSEVKWFFPKLKNNHFLAVPLHDGPEPLCVFFIKDPTKHSEQIDIRNLF